MDQFRKRILLAAALLLSMTILSGCFFLNAMAGAFSPTQKYDPSSASETSVSETILPTTAETVIPAASDKAFTGLSATLPDDGSVILASDMYNGGTAELLRVDPQSLGYRISLYTPATGELTDAFAGTLTGPVSGNDSAYYLKRDNFTVLSSAPLVFEDRLAKTVYSFADDFSAAKIIDISAWNVCAMAFSNMDRCLYYENYSDNALYRYSIESGDSVCVYTPNTDYDSVWLESILGNAGIAVFSGVRALDRAFIDILVDLKTGAVLCEVTGDVDFYESDQGIYAVRKEDNRILVGFFDPAALTFSSCCEIDFDSYYTDMYVDGTGGRLFLCTWRDGHSYLISCYDLCSKTLVYRDPFDIDAYSSGQVPAAGEDAANDEDTANGEDAANGEDTANGEDAAAGFVGLSFGGRSPYSNESNGLMITADTKGVIRDVIFWNLGEAGTPALALADTESWDSVVCIKPGLTADSDTNAAYASSISEEFGVQVRIGEDANTSFSEYTFTEMEDEVHIYRSLCVLEETLALYPEGFFREFDDAHSDGVTFYLVERINSLYGEAYDDPYGVTSADDGKQEIAVSGSYLSAMRSTLIHEISHVIDYRLESIAYFDDVTYLDEGVWSDMNPDDFEYYYDYVDENDVGYDESGSTEYTPYSDAYLKNEYMNGLYFVSVYSKTYPTEDRACLMETVMYEGGSPDYIGGKHIQEKLVYYFSAIRAAWDSSEWPETTTWEASLDENHPLIATYQLLLENANGKAA